MGSHTRLGGSTVLPMMNLHVVDFDLCTWNAGVSGMIFLVEFFCHFFLEIFFCLRSALWVYGLIGNVGGRVLGLLNDFLISVFFGFGIKMVTNILKCASAFIAGEKMLIFVYKSI